MVYVRVCVRHSRGFHHSELQYYLHFSPLFGISSSSLDLKKKQLHGLILDGSNHLVQPLWSVGTFSRKFWSKIDSMNQDFVNVITSPRRPCTFHKLIELTIQAQAHFKRSLSVQYNDVERPTHEHSWKKRNETKQKIKTNDPTKSVKHLKKK